LAGFIAFVSPIHDQWTTRWSGTTRAQQLTPLRRISRLTGRQRQTQGALSIRGNQMNLGGAAASGTADGLRPTFFKAPCRRDAL